MFWMENWAVRPLEIFGLRFPPQLRGPWRFAAEVFLTRQLSICVCSCYSCATVLGLALTAPQMVIWVIVQGRRSTGLLCLQMTHLSKCRVMSNRSPLYMNHIFLLFPKWERGGKPGRGAFGRQWRTSVSVDSTSHCTENSTAASNFQVLIIKLHSEKMFSH